jgi:YD repeat-containing protein
VSKPQLGVTHYQYDDPDSLAVDAVYHLVTRETRADGTYTVYEYDSNGIAARKPSEELTYSAGDTLLQTESWVYDPNGNVTSETRPDGIDQRARSVSRPVVHP